MASKCKTTSVWSRNVASCGNGGARGNPPSGRRRLWCAPHLLITRARSRFQRYGTPVRRHGGGQRKSYICSARQVFSDSSTQKPFFNSIPASNLTSRRLRGQYFDSNHSVKVTWRWVCAREDRAYASHWLGIHRWVRYEWAMDHVRWTLGDWRPVLFLQTSLDIALTSPIGVLGCGEGPGERLHGDNITEHDRYGGGSVMVLGRNRLGWAYWPLRPSPWHIDPHNGIGMTFWVVHVRPYRRCNRRSPHSNRMITPVVTLPMPSRSILKGKVSSVLTGPLDLQI